ncbi:unnamed protein product [Coccothraustes coccothraustes]
MRKIAMILEPKVDQVQEKRCQIRQFYRSLHSLLSLSNLQRIKGLMKQNGLLKMPGTLQPYDLCKSDQPAAASGLDVFVRNFDPAIILAVLNLRH